MRSSMSEECLANLFEEHYGTVLRFVAVRSSRSIAEEVTSVTFEEAARRFERGDGHSIELPWLLTVARRRLIDYWRKLERDLRLVNRITELREPASNPYPHCDDVDELLSRLSPDQQKAVLLRYVEGFTISEVAKEIGRSYRGAESLICRAKHQLRSHEGIITGSRTSSEGD